jgi:hypothetical protein
MAPETPRSSPPAVTGAAAQRTAEQAALRKVREELDHLAAQEARQRKLIRTLVIVAAAVFLVLLFVVWRNVASRADKAREAPPVQIPSKVDMSKKPAPTQAEPGK